MDDKHPCDLCHHGDKCTEIGCKLNTIYHKILECQQYDCFLNYEGTCKICAYDDCGSRMTADGTVPEVDQNFF